MYEGIRDCHVALLLAMTPQKPLNEPQFAAKAAQRLPPPLKYQVLSWHYKVFRQFRAEV